MDILKFIVVIIYFIVGAALGILIIPEVVNDIGVTSYPILKNHYIDGLLGALIFFIIFGFFINQVTQLIRTMEQWIMKRSAVEILFATIGLIIGLLIAVMESFYTNYYYINFMLFRISIWFKETRRNVAIFTRKYGAFNVAKSS